MKNNKIFDITIMGVNFKSNEDGMLDLNDIWRGCDLSSSKRPNEFFRYSNGKYLLENGNSRLNEINYLGAGKTKYYTADEVATVAYAMWVSMEFYMMVVGAFVALRQGAIVEAAKIADSTQLESKAFSKWMGYSDTTLQQSLGMLGINRPNLFQSIAKNGKQLDKFLELGVLKYRNYGNKGSHLRVTKVGKQYLLDNKDNINIKIEEIYRANKELM